MINTILRLTGSLIGGFLYVLLKYLHNGLVVKEDIKTAIINSIIIFVICSVIYWFKTRKEARNAKRR